jgi:hypothetical protein
MGCNSRLIVPKAHPHLAPRKRNWLLLIAVRKRSHAALFIVFNWERAGLSHSHRKRSSAQQSSGGLMGSTPSDADAPDNIRSVQQHRVIYRQQIISRSFGKLAVTCHRVVPPIVIGSNGGSVLMVSDEARVRSHADVDKCGAIPLAGIQTLAQQFIDQPCRCPPQPALPPVKRIEEPQLA